MIKFNLLSARRQLLSDIPSGNQLADLKTFILTMICCPTGYMASSTREGQSQLTLSYFSTGSGLDKSRAGMHHPLCPSSQHGSLCGLCNPSVGQWCRPTRLPGAELSPLYRYLYAVISPRQVSVCSYLPFTDICMQLSPLYRCLYAIISPLQVSVCKMCVGKHHVHGTSTSRCWCIASNLESPG